MIMAPQVASVRSSHNSARFQASTPSHTPCSGLTFSRGWLIQISEETLRIAKTGKYTNRRGREVDISAALDNALKNSVHYHSSHVFEPQKTTAPRFESTEYCVCYGSSLQVATKLQDELVRLHGRNNAEVGILNSASGTNPDKFLRGTLSQEEGLCRASLLYPCLEQYKDRPHHFYYVNKKPKYQESSSSCAIFCPRVPVIRDDSMRGDLLDDYREFSFVNIPAPNAFVLGSDDEEALIPKAQKPGSNESDKEFMSIDSAMRDRLFRALAVFAEHGCTDLVLCAFGCGVHGNNPRKIATCFKSILSNELKGRFRLVVFAIQPSRPQNYEEFASVFE
mmetsp:Transcript_41067/g.98987  ORF Transcript_41067/g.98987 Transcript_41067/m.98987 type:complete len:336 (-) Transcript_41067:62-1069(-)